MGKLEDLMKCPVNWDDQTGRQNWDWSLMRLDWHETLRNSVAEGADLPFYPEDYTDLYEEPDVLRSVIINLEFGRPKAIEAYMARAGRLEGLKFMAPAEQSKHFRPWTKKEDVMAQTVSGPSLFWRTTTVSA
jgi:hypothetical protein